MMSPENLEQAYVSSLVERTELWSEIKRLRALVRNQSTTIQQLKTRLLERAS